MSFPAASDGDGRSPRPLRLPTRARRGAIAVLSGRRGDRRRVAAGRRRRRRSLPHRAQSTNANASPLAPREFVRTLRVTGLTEATRSYVVTVPFQTGGGSASGGGVSLVITRLVRPGSHVARGDVLVEFDRQNQDKLAFEKAAEYRDLVEQIAKKRAEHEAARVKDESEREQAANKVEHLELEVLKNEMLAAIKAEKNNQDLDEARQRLAALRASFDLKRQAARAELRVLEIKRDRAQAAMEHAAANATALTIRSPIDGLVVPRTTWKGAGPGRRPGRRSALAGRARAGGGEPGLDAGARAREPGRHAAPAEPASRSPCGSTPTRISRCPAASRRSRRSRCPARSRRGCARSAPSSPSTARATGCCPT